MAIEIGTDAPDFSLKDQNGDVVTLSSFEGQSPSPWCSTRSPSPGCARASCARIRDDFSEFEAAGVKVLAISCDSRFAQAKWAEEMGYTFPVLSDFWPHGEAAKAFGVFNDALGCANRGTFVIDVNGKVVDAFESPDLGTARPADRYRQAIATL